MAKKKVAKKRARSEWQVLGTTGELSRHKTRRTAEREYLDRARKNPGEYFSTRQIIIPAGD